MTKFIINPFTGLLDAVGTGSGSSGIVTIDGDSGSITGTTVTISGGTTGLTTLGSGTTMDLTGTLALANGGTSASLTASDGGIFYSTASAGAILSGTSTAHRPLFSGASTAPTWSGTTYPNTIAINSILYASSANAVDAITPVVDGVLVSDATGIPSWLSNGTAGYVLTAQSSAPPAWALGAVGGEGVSLFVVDSQGTQGYTTINAAITAASLVASMATPQTVWIWPGSYPEDVSLASYVNLSAAADGVYITGNATYIGSGGAAPHVKNMTFITPSGGGAAFNIRGGANTLITFNDCVFVGSFGICFEFTAGSESAAFNNCIFNAASTFSIFSMNQTNVAVTLFSCLFGSTDTPSSIQGGINFNMIGCTGAETYTVGSSTVFQVANCAIHGTNSTAVFSILSGGTVNVTNSQIEAPSSTYWATGAGTLNYGNIVSHQAVNVGTLTTTGENSFSGAISFDGGSTHISTKSGGLATTPSSSNTATTAFGSTLTAGTATQNTSGYDLLINICVSVTSSTTSTITLGVGSSSTPGTNTVIPSFSLAVAGTYTFSAYVPNTYYVLVNSTGTIVISSITVQAMAI